MFIVVAVSTLFVDFPIVEEKVLRLDMLGGCSDGIGWVESSISSPSTISERNEDRRNSSDSEELPPKASSSFCELGGLTTAPTAPCHLGLFGAR